MQGSTVYKITPCDSANAIGGTKIINNRTDSATNGIGGDTWGNFDCADY